MRNRPKIPKGSHSRARAAPSNAKALLAKESTKETETPRITAAHPPGKANPGFGLNLGDITSIKLKNAKDDDSAKTP